jgi:hypothetical protein
MIAIDPDEIIVNDSGTHFEPIHADAAELIADLSKGVNIKQQWQMTIPEQGPMTYFRITPQMRDFLKLCHEKHGVIGFEYDFDEAGLNFGLVLRKEATDGNAN